MSQADLGILDPNTTSGVALANLLKGWRDALHASHAGAERPAYVRDGMLWVRQVSGTVWELNLFEGGADIVLGVLNPATNVWTPRSSGVALGSAAVANIGAAAGDVPSVAIGDARWLTPAAADLIYQAQGRQTIAVPAAAMTPWASGGASPQSVVQIVSGQPNRIGIDFDANVAQSVQLQLPMPKSWDRGPINIQYIWTQPAAGAGNVVWGAQAVATGDGDALAAAFGAAVDVTDEAGGVANQVRVSALSANMAVGGNPAVDDLTIFRIFRDPADAGDTLAVPATLIGVRILFNVNARNDA